MSLGVRADVQALRGIGVLLALLCPAAPRGAAHRRAMASVLPVSMKGRSYIVLRSTRQLAGILQSAAGGAR